MESWLEANDVAAAIGVGPCATASPPPPASPGSAAFAWLEAAEPTGDAMARFAGSEIARQVLAVSKADSEL